MPGATVALTCATVTRPARRAFVHLHRTCGTLTGSATEPAWNGYLVTVACSCGVASQRWVTPEEAGEDLLRSPLLAFEN